MATAEEVLIVLRSQNQASGDVRTLRGDLTSLERAAHGAAGGLSSIGSSAQAATGFLRGAAQQAVAFGGALVALQAAQAVVDKIGQAISSGFNFQNMQQQSQLAFETMLGSADAARAHLGDLVEFARATPFEMPGLAAADQKLNAFNFTAQDTIPMLTTIGDAMAGLGRGEEGVNRAVVALGQMQAKTKASSEEMMQLVELGVPAWEGLARTIGTDIPTAMKLVEQGAVSSGDAIAGVLSIMDERFSGLMEKQSKTLGGLANTLRDTWNQALGAVLEPAVQRATALMDELAQATNTPEFAQGLQSMAQGLDDLLNAIAPLGDAVKKVFGGDLQGALGIIDETVGGWIDAFTDWVPSATEGMLHNLEQMWGQLAPWLEDKAKLFTQKFLEHWLPGSVDWILKEGLPLAIKKFGEFAGGILDWAGKEGAELFRKSGSKLAASFIEGYANIGAAIREVSERAGEAAGEAIGRDLGNEWRRLTGQPLHGQGPPGALGPTSLIGPPSTFMSGGVEVSYADANEHNRAAIEANNAYLQSIGLLPQQTADILSETEDVAAASGSRARTNWFERFSGAGSTASSAAKESAAKVGREAAETAIEGFMRAAQSNLSRWEAIFGEWGGQGAAALETALASNSGSAGAALRKWVDEATTKLREAGVPEFQDVADKLAGAFHDALVDRGNPAAKSAALEMIRTVTETLKAAQALTPENFAQSFNAAQLSASFGSGGASIMEALDTALEEGGVRARETLARAVQSMQMTFLQDKDLSPERSEALAAELMDRFNAMIRDKSPETRAAFEAFLQEVNFEVPLERARQRMEQQLDEARQKTVQAIQDAKDQANAEIDRLFADARTQSFREGHRELLGQQEQGITGLENNRYAGERERLANQRETRDLEKDISRYATDTAAAREKELAALQKRLAEQANQRKGQNANIGQAMGKAESLIDNELKALQDRWKAEDARRATELQRRKEDRDQQKADADEDKANATRHASNLDQIHAHFQGLRTEMENYWKNSDLNARAEEILGRAVDTERSLNAQLVTLQTTLQTEYAELERRMNLIKDTLLPQVQAVADTVFDGALGDLREMHRLWLEMQRGGGGGGGNAPAPPPSGGATALAAGGIVTRPTLALIGESGPEAVVPLSRMPSAPPSTTTVEHHYHVHVTGNTFVGSDPAAERRVGQMAAQAMSQRAQSLSAVTGG